MQTLSMSYAYYTEPLRTVTLSLLASGNDVNADVVLMSSPATSEAQNARGAVQVQISFLSGALTRQG